MKTSIRGDICSTLAAVVLGVAFGDDGGGGDAED